MTALRHGFTVLASDRLGVVVLCRCKRWGAAMPTVERAETVYRDQHLAECGFRYTRDDDERRSLLMAQQRQVCGYCRGNGSTRIERVKFEPCGRCKGKGTIRTGKVETPCSGCGGAGGRNRTQLIQATCGRCGGKGYR